MVEAVYFLVRFGSKQRSRAHDIAVRMIPSGRVSRSRGGYFSHRLRRAPGVAGFVRIERLLERVKLCGDVSAQTGRVGEGARVDGRAEAAGERRERARELGAVP